MVLKALVCTAAESSISHLPAVTSPAVNALRWEKIRTNFINFCCLDLITPRLLIQKIQIRAHWRKGEVCGFGKRGRDTLFT